MERHGSGGAGYRSNDDSRTGRRNDPQRTKRPVEGDVGIQIGGDESHGIGAYEADGLGFHENGEVSTYVSKGLYDWRHGTDQHSGYVVRTYADGSTTTSHFEGTTSSDAGTATWNGTVVYVSGTGRFDGIKGEGTYEGQRYLNKMSVTDWEMRVVLPD